MKRLAAALVFLASPTFAQDRSNNIEQVETPQGTVTIVRPAQRAQPSVPGPAVNPDPVPPPPATPFPRDQDGRYAPPYSGGVGGAYPVLTDPRPSIVIIERRRAPVMQTPDPRRFDDVGPVPPFVPYEPRRLEPGTPLQSQGGFGRPLPSPRYSPNQFGPGAVPGSVPLPDASRTIIIVPR